MTRQQTTEATWKAVINWHEEAILLSHAQTDTHPFLERKGWFAIVAAELPDSSDISPFDTQQLLYIGDAFNVPLRDKLVREGALQRRINAACPRGKQLIAILGTPTQRSRKRRSAAYLDGVLHALRRSHNPVVADQRTAGRYNGEVVAVENEGEPLPLKARVSLAPDAIELTSSRSADDTQPKHQLAVGLQPVPAKATNTVVRRKNSGRIRPPREPNRE